MRVLLVEDNEMNRDMLSRRLSRRGFDVLIAVDGAQGIQVAKTELPDLILMDMSLPVVDGWEATRQLKTDTQTQSIPVIAAQAKHLTVFQRTPNFSLPARNHDLSSDYQQDWKAKKE